MPYRLSSICLLIVTFAFQLQAQGAAAPSSASAHVNAANFPNLQAAIDALPPTGGLVEIPPGTYTLNAPLTIRTDDVTLRGAGGSTHLHNANTNNQPAILIDSNTPHPTRRGKTVALWRIQIENLRLTGNDQSGHGIHAKNVNEILIHAATISEHGGDGILLDYCYEDPRINDCLITYNKKNGLNLIGCHDIVVSANHFEENFDGVRCVNGFNLTMTGNNLDDHLGDGIVIEKMMGSTISANMIEQCKGWGITFDRDTYGINFTANVMSNDTAGGVALRDAHAINISANTFSTVPRNALHIGPKASRVNVTGNTFNNAYLGEGVIRTQAAENGEGSGITLDGAQQILITSNTFAQLTGKALGIGSRAPSRILFANNQIIDCDSDHHELKNSVVKDNLE